MQLDAKDSEGLLAGLKNDNMFWRTTAQRLIVESGNNSIVPELYTLINNQSVDEIGLNSPAVHALWTLHGLGELDGSNNQALEVATNALTHPAAGVRKNAIKVLPKDEKTLSAILEAGLLEDADLRTRMAAVLAVADIPGYNKAGELLYEASSNSENAEDQYLPQAFFAAALSYQDSFLEAAPQDLDTAKADSLLTLPERIIKSMNEEEYALGRWRPILFPPDITEKEITLKFTLSP